MSSGNDDPYDDEQPDTQSETEGGKKITVPLDRYGRVSIPEGTGEIVSPPQRTIGTPVGKDEFEKAQEVKGGVWKKQPDGRFNPLMHVGAMPTRLPYDPTKFTGSTKREIRPYFEVLKTLSVSPGSVSAQELMTIIEGHTHAGIWPPSGLWHALSGRPDYGAVLAYAEEARRYLISQGRGGLIQ